MKNPALGPRVIRFGVFEFSPQTGELRKHGLKVRLEPQASKILLLLLEYPGKICTREELQQHLWQDIRFGVFEFSPQTGELRKHGGPKLTALGEARPLQIEPAMKRPIASITAAITSINVTRVLRFIVCRLLCGSNSVHLCQHCTSRDTAMELFRSGPRPAF